MFLVYLLKLLSSTGSIGLFLEGKYTTLSIPECDDHIKWVITTTAVCPNISPRAPPNGFDQYLFSTTASQKCIFWFNNFCRSTLARVSRCLFNQEPRLQPKQTQLYIDDFTTHASKRMYYWETLTKRNIYNVNFYNFPTRLNINKNQINLKCCF